MLTREEIARLVGAGIAAVREPPVNEPQIPTSRLKMENPGKFDGKSLSAFNQWWESVTMYLGFYPETVDRQKIAWVVLKIARSPFSFESLHKYREREREKREGQDGMI